jgi:peptidyl-prolyl cis-trans isomerase A (cyclophilin A)
MKTSRFFVACALGASLLTGLLLPLNGHAQSNGISKVRISTSMGDIEAELYADKAPRTVANFLQYVKDKHYDGTLFHRVISSFMVQGGGYDAKYQQKPTRAPIEHEGRKALAAGLKNTTGTLAMAGMDVVQKIRNTPTGAGGPFPSDVPKTAVLIQSVTLLK